VLSAAHFGAANATVGTATGGGGISTIDGLPAENVFAAILATAAGKVTITDNGDGTYTADFKRQNGTTTALSVTYNPASGSRAVTGTIPT
jgi:hypothetical protein